MLYDGQSSHGNGGHSQHKGPRTRQLPKCGAKLDYFLILGPKFWECSNQGFYPTLFNPGYVKFGLDNLDLVLALGVCYVL